MIPLLASKSLTAITNSLTHAVEMAKHGNKDIKVVGGKLHQIQLFLYGSDTVLELSQYRVDYTLLGVFAITGTGLYIHTEEEGLVKRAMVNCAKKSHRSCGFYENGYNRLLQSLCIRGY